MFFTRKYPAFNRAFLLRSNDRMQSRGQLPPMEKTELRSRLQENLNMVRITDSYLIRSLDKADEQIWQRR